MIYSAMRREQNLKAGSKTTSSSLEMLLFLKKFGLQNCIEQDSPLFVLFPWSFEVVGSILLPPTPHVLRGSHSQIMQFVTKGYYETNWWQLLFAKRNVSSL
jgi:hypothetical protein